VPFCSILAQDIHYEAGLAAYQNREYDEALKRFDIALEDKYLMKGKNVPRAYNYRAKTIAEYFEVVLAENHTEYIISNPNILVNAFEDLDKAIAFDDGRCNALIADTKSQLFDVTFKFSQSVADSLRIDRGSNDPKTDSLILLIIDELLILKSIQNESYVINDLLGLLEFKEGDIVKAIEFFEESERIYNQNPPMLPDYNHVYNYYYEGLIQYQELHDFDKAQVSVQAGRTFLNDHFKNDKRAKALDKKLEALEFQIKLLKN
jgi:tetratricopeptide (TPR) repeat protein